VTYGPAPYAYVLSSALLGFIGITQPLVDAEGFPRADIDVYRARHLRHRLACLKTDFKTLSKQIEQQLHELHSQHREPEEEEGEEQKMQVEEAIESTGAQDNGASGKGADEAEEAWKPAWYRPFALVDELSPGSPAAEAGLRLGDEVLSFGECTREAIERSGGLQPIVQVVQGNVGQEVRVVVVRNCARTLLKLVPKTWEGKGLLGCHLQPSRGSVVDWPESYRKKK